MHLSHLCLSGFRNYNYAEFEFDRHTNVIYGQNGEGKTNILEAIFLLGTLQSFRTHDHKSLIQWGKEKAYINGKVQRDDLEKDLSLSILSIGKKASINGKRVKKRSDYFGSLHVISFNPMEMHILHGSPKVRRTCLDQMLLNFDPLYRQELIEYYQILLQRNSALKFGEWNMVDLWWEKMSVTAAKIIFKRLQFIQKLTRLASSQYQAISDEDSEVNIQYHSNVFINDSKEIEMSDLLGLLEKKQMSLCHEERRSSQTLVGPHRDDFSIVVNGNDLRRFGSQGEHRTAILALKLSEFAVLEEETAIKAVVLLDDIASELDEVRKRNLFELLQGNKTQIFVTTTDGQTVSMLKNKAKLFCIKLGIPKIDD